MKRIPVCIGRVPDGKKQCEVALSLATYTFRSGVPIEIVSKVILRHVNLSTTQKYLGTVSDVGAMRRIDNL